MPYRPKTTLSPTPWHWHNFAAIADADGDWLFWYTTDDDGIHASKADIERIIACVNALSGLTNEQVGRLAQLFALIRLAHIDTGTPAEMHLRAGIIPAARAAGIIKE